MTRLALILAALLIAGPAIAREPQLLLCADPGVIDGDTLRCDGFKIRIWGIQAPERHDPGGPASTRAMADLTTGQTLVCRRRGHSYDRIVAQCFIGKRDVAAEMVRQGQAVDWPKFSKGFYARGGRGR